MTNEQLQQVEEWLAGQRRYQLLDTTDKSLLRLKGSRLQVWLAHFIGGSDEGEAWLSLETLKSLTGLSENTVSTAREWLVENAWLEHTGGVAASKYANPTRGSHTLKVVRAVTPPHSEGTSQPVIPSISAPSEFEEPTELTPSKVTPSHIEDKVYGSGSSSCSGSSSITGMHMRMRIASGANAPDVLTNVKARATPKTTATTKPKATTPVSAATLRHSSKYDSPFPDEFNSWTNLERTAWCAEHKLKPGSQPESVQEQEPVSVQAPVQVPSTVNQPTAEQPAPDVAPAVDVSVEESKGSARPVAPPVVPSSRLIEPPNSAAPPAEPVPPPEPDPAIGAWEYIKDDGRFRPYGHDVGNARCLQCGIARDPDEIDGHLKEAHHKVWKQLHGIKTIFDVLDEQRLRGQY